MYYKYIKNEQCWFLLMFFLQRCLVLYLTNNETKIKSQIVSCGGSIGEMQGLGVSGFYTNDRVQK